MTSFPNLKLGTGILQQSLTQLVQYYHRWWWIFRLLMKCLLQVILDFDHSQNVNTDSAECWGCLHFLRSLQPHNWSTSTSSWSRSRSTSPASEWKLEVWAAWKCAFKLTSMSSPKWPCDILIVFIMPLKARPWFRYSMLQMYSMWRAIVKLK